MAAALLDREVAFSRVGGDVELLREIAALFVEDYPSALENLQTAVQNNDARLLERTAHGLKGSVANFGAQSAVDAAMHLERMGFAKDLSNAAATLATLNTALSSLRIELESLCNELS